MAEKEPGIKTHPVKMAVGASKILGNTVYFAGRRLARKASGPNALKSAGDIILIDMDFTLLKSNTIFELFKVTLGEAEGKKLLNHYKRGVVRGHYSLEEAMLLGYEKMIEAGVTVKDAEKLVDSLIEKGVVREEIVEVARELRASGKKVVIASKMSETIAGLFAKKLGFDYGIGSRERIDGKTGRVLKIEELVGDFTGYTNLFKRNEKGRKIRKSKRAYRVVSKIDRVADAFRQKKEPFDPNRVTVLSDGLEGLYSRKHAKFGVLFVPTRRELTETLGKHRRTTARNRRRPR